MSVMRVWLRALYLSLPLVGSAACMVAACKAGDHSPPAPPDDAAQADTGIHKVKHVIVVMQENHSFDNYFGALAYAPHSPYHEPAAARTGCGNDHGCVD